MAVTSEESGTFEIKTSAAHNDPLSRNTPAKKISDLSRFGPTIEVRLTSGDSRYLPSGALDQL
jgi:hypothetical protein